MLTSVLPSTYHELTAAAYTYALIHQPSDPKRVYLGYATDVRKAINMWDMRLRNPHGNPGVPKPMNSFDWQPDEWFFKLGKGYDTPLLAREAFVSAVQSKPTGFILLNGTHRPRAVPREPREPRSRNNQFINWPSPVPYEAMQYEWPVFLRWVMSLPGNQLGNPSDAQVKEAWELWHREHGREPTYPVPDPDRAMRHKKAVRNRVYVARYRAKKKGGA